MGKTDSSTPSLAGLTEELVSTQKITKRQRQVLLAAFTKKKCISSEALTDHSILEATKNDENSFENATEIQLTVKLPQNSGIQQISTRMCALTMKNLYLGFCASLII